VKPRLLLVGPLPPPPGGVGRLVESIVASPLAARWSIDVFNLSKPQQEGRPSTVTPWDVAWTLVHLVALPLRLLRRRPRVALVQSTADTGFVRDLALVLVLRAFAVPVVLHWHGAPESLQFPGPASGAPRARLFRFGVRRARRIIVLAEPYRPFFAGYIEAARLAVVPNFVDRGRIDGPSDRAADAGAGGEGAARFVFLGRIGPEKGVDVLLDAFAQARARVPGIGLELVGAGETPEAFAAAAAHPAVRSGAARLLGPLDEERFARLRHADAFVLPTRADSFPLSILEAMAAGLPVIASDVGAIRWLLDDGRCGALLPAGDVAALADTLVSAATHRDEWRGRGAAARRRQAACFDAPVVADRLDAILRQAAGLAPDGAGGSR
jgi:glycosyltransferase involved in cell wall biosynthesis